MEVKDWLPQATKRLKNAGISSARLDCLLLLEDALHKDRTYLLARPELSVKGRTFHKLDRWVTVRTKHVPLAYIRGKTEFYGREFIIMKYVLEPRPESEAMIDVLKKLPLDKPVIADIGTGSGVLAITAKFEIPKATVLATDIDPKCLKVAEKNALLHDVDIGFMEANLLTPALNNRYDPLTNSDDRQKKLMNGGKNTKNSKNGGESVWAEVIMANLPYVPDYHHINRAAAMEPRLAIFGGKDGLNIYRGLFKQINDSSEKPKYILTESLPFQHVKLSKIASNSNYCLEQTDNFIQLFRQNS